MRKAFVISGFLFIFVCMYIFQRVWSETRHSAAVEEGTEADANGCSFLCWKWICSRILLWNSLHFVSVVQQQQSLMSQLSSIRFNVHFATEITLYLRTDVQKSVVSEDFWRSAMLHLYIHSQVISHSGTLWSDRNSILRLRIHLACFTLRSFLFCYIKLKFVIFLCRINFYLLILSRSFWDGCKLIFYVHKSK